MPLPGSVLGYPTGNLNPMPGSIDIISEWLMWEQVRAVARDEDKKLFGTITDEERAKWKEEKRIFELRYKRWYNRVWRAVRNKWNLILNLRIVDIRNWQEDDED